MTEHKEPSFGDHCELEAEFERLTAEAVSRLSDGETLPALASLYAAQPIIGTLLRKLSGQLDLNAQPDGEEQNHAGGIYL